MKKEISRLILKKYLDFQYRPDALPENPDFAWIRNSGVLPWLPLDIVVPTDVICEEIKNIKHLLVSHRDDYAEHSGWESFCIHGRGYNFTREDAYYKNAPDYHWTKEAQELMPETTNFFRHFWPGQTYQRLRVMRLKPGGYIAVHKDSTVSRLHPINIAITQPTSCCFVMEKYGKVPFVPGKSFWLDVSNRHVVFNDSDQDRWHIIVHQVVDHPDFQKMVVSSYKIMYNNMHDKIL